MAVNFNDPKINDPFEYIEENFNERDIDWLYYYLMNIEGNHLDYKTYYGSKITYLINKIKDKVNPELTVKIILQSYEKMLSDRKNIKWLDIKNPRLIMFTYHYLKANYPHQYPINDIEVSSIESAYKVITLNWDIIIRGDDEKQNFIKELREAWSSLMTPNTKLKWIDPKNEEQLDWIINYLGNCEIKQLGLYLTILKPVNNFEKHNYILIILDKMSIHTKTWHPANKELLLQRLRKAWSQKKFRDEGKTKKQYHLPLTKNAKLNLTKIAAKDNLSEAATLERLINEEWEKIKDY